MIVICVSFLLSVHFSILFLYMELITPGSLIVLLYLSNMILILTALGRELCPFVERNFKEEVLSDIVHDLKEPSCTFSPRSLKDRWPNLYIKRWKTKYLDRPVEYPLDRIAYLTAKYTPPVTYSCSLLKNSQLKQLVKRSNSGGHELLFDELHPSKMVSECFDIYINRRSVFYTERNVICGGLKQITRKGKEIKFREMAAEELMSQDSLPGSSVVDSKCHSSDDSSSETETDRHKQPASRSATRVRRMWRKVSRAFSH